MAHQLTDLSPQWTDPMLKNGNFTFLLLPLILAVASSGQEWQYDISIVNTHIGRSTGKSNPLLE